MIKLRLDKEVDAAYIHFSDGQGCGSEEVIEDFILDYDVNNNVIGIEVLDYSKQTLQSFLSIRKYLSRDQVLALKCFFLCTP